MLLCVLYNYNRHQLAGEQLRGLLQKHGNFKDVEIAVQKWTKRTQNDGKEGAWVTKAFLMDQKGYTK